MTTIEQIQNNETYKQVLKDSIGGLMYDTSNRGKYNAEEVLSLWDGLTASEQETCGGIMKGAMSFLKGD